jgi:hypothetical protein
MDCIGRGKASRAVKMHAIGKMGNVGCVSCYRRSSEVGRRAVQPLASIESDGTSADVPEAVAGSATLSVTDTICSEPGTSPVCWWPPPALADEIALASVGLWEISGDVVMSDVPANIEPAR